MSIAVAPSQNRASWQKTYYAADQRNPFDLAGAGEGLIEVTRLTQSALSHYSKPVSRHAVGRFLELAADWKQSTQFHSSLTDIVLNASYQQIIGMGPAVVPYILRDLYEEPHHWSWALSALTGEDPVDPEHYGDIEQMANDWILWGIEKGYL